jgi:hypothetical protein
MKINFENDFQQKIMLQSFAEPSVIASKADVTSWRSIWTSELKSWHSPYKVIVDCSHLTIHGTPEVVDALKLMLKFFEGLFLKSIVGYGLTGASSQVESLPLRFVGSFEEAQTAAGVRGIRGPANKTDFRSTIQFQNHFAQHVIELSFSDDVLIDSKEKIDILKSKLTNNLMQWHSKWSLLIDCSHVEFADGIKDDWHHFTKYFASFFMKSLVGYQPKPEVTAEYPFKAYRARHKAVAMLESEGNFMGNEATCRSTAKKSPS